ncbi:3-oxo-tetronate kinase [Streptomyces montanisoli]|uniref:3-oxo-tetronate kinase n=1 Tax=Streptomyces montanisoli TaxID=2798581 RepID=A0A940M8T8_9ACTN|nr:3-oxo-tetronate kinase [Streptomyces montanisoli]MBP0456889.1 four-carbon acid sugar kinase family protein [Streptomyces montanisoli]
MIELGCIADDFTGATDLAGNLVATGRRTVVTVGPPRGPVTDADAVVVALKTRTVAADLAVAAALDAHRALARLGCTRYWFKYCSTFDSTPLGNIGPVIDALLTATGAPWTIACPAFPAAGRTVYQGHLFVGDRLLAESGMRHHPLTPMTDSDLMRVLGAQTAHPVGLLPHAILRAGGRAVSDHLDRLTAQGARIVVTDALGDEDLTAVERATHHLPLVTGGSGLALALPARRESAATDIEVAPGPTAVLAGSVSDATLAQTAHARARMPHRKLDPAAVVASPDAAVADVLAWARTHLDAGRNVLIHSAGDRAEVDRAQEAFGRDRVGEATERALARCASGLADAGVRRFVVAGGETSGAVVDALAVRTLRIGPAIAAGVPWTAAQRRGTTLNLALKSGNFGEKDLFTRAEDHL